MHRVTALVLVALTACAGRATSSSPDDLPPTDACAGERDCIEACADGDVQSCAVLGHSLLREGAFDDAAEAFERGCRLDDAEACAQQVRALRLGGREGEADRRLREACEPGTSESLCRAVTGALDRPEERWEVAEIHAARCREGDEISCREQGRELIRRGETAEAVAPLDRACQGGDLESCVDLANALETLGRREGADEARRRAAELQAGD